MAKKSSALSRRDPQTAEKEDNTTGPAWTRTQYDILNPPPLTPEQQEELRLLAEKPDGDINFSDIAPLDDDFWKNAGPNRFYQRALKEQLTIRLDADVLDWFRSQAENGKGYQTSINRVLRDYVEAQRKKTG